MKRSSLALGNFLNLTIQLRGRSLIYLAGLDQAADADSFQHTQDTQCVHITGIFRSIEGDPNMALSSQIVDFIGLDLAHQTNQARRIGQVAIMQLDGVLLDQVVDAGSIRDESAADDAVDFVALFQKKLGQLGTILTCDICFYNHKRIQLKTGLSPLSLRQSG